ncbi:CRISPR-associated protein Cse2 [Corynebacterium atrinae]|uniref:type I-E CRISPR-associated protein Cse2/CasB n=1 Tax=Corynebacterium atrinae TaxID=1336740 RepID=UPI0025B33AD6|nr:type I-E CRISPR-associated protein Cse2/CasB [Corynebacterium atrinae]WJY64493.1 CRISPR-associated protein Cse2 [Corynebacterium atrinae]
MTNSPPDGPERDSLFGSVGATATRLQSQYLGEKGERLQAQARGILAELRRRAGQPIEQDPLSLEKTLMVLTPALNENSLGRTDAPSRSESAAFHALSLFALHMQSATHPMHQRGTSFASACGRLYAMSESASLKPRFDALLLARSSRSRLSHTRSMITLLRGSGLGFDYAQFANDLRSLDSAERRPGVLLRWGRDFAMGRFSADSSTSS